MASLTVRGTRIYAKIKNIDGVPKRVRTDFVDGQQEQAQRWADEQEERIANARAKKPAGAVGELTITLYARAWLAKRKTKTVGDDKGRLENHVIPRIGHVPVKDARPRHFRDLIMALRNETGLAPKTIREISGLCHTLFNSAIIDELVTENPVKYEKGVLPKKLDKDPSWRRQAIYTRPEVEQLFSDERIPIDRRVLYALKFFTGRHGEVSGLTWEQWDPTIKPLGALAVDVTKTLVPRLIPVHPTLAKILAAWKLAGWEDLYGDKPRPVDLIVPTRNLTRRDPWDAQEQLIADLTMLGLRVKAGKERNRRGHDLRRTFITLARGAGAIDSVLRWITHGPKPSEILDTYSSPPWESLCAEVLKLKIELREGKVIAMAANDPSGAQGPEKVQPRRMGAKGGLLSFKERPGRDSNLRAVGQGDTRHQENRTVGPEEVSPNGTDVEGLDPGEVQILTGCDLSILAMMEAYADPDA
jgi:integrase